MDVSIACVLLQDGIASGAIYALIGLALVLVFQVTRVILVPQGEFVSFGALTLAVLLDHRVPGTLWLGLACALLAFGMDVRQAIVERTPLRLPALAIRWLLLPLANLALTLASVNRGMPLWFDVALAMMLVAPLGPSIYRIAFQPMAEASVLMLLIAAVGVHYALVGLGLAFFGAEGSRTPAFVDAQFEVAGVSVSGQSAAVLAFAAVLMVALFGFLGRTYLGLALRATAVDRRGARLMGISATNSGQLVFLLAALVGSASGILVAPLTAIYYDTGFLIGLKGFVAAIIGGLASFPMTALGALFVGQLEAFAAFWASPLKEVIVFSLILPILIWRSLRAGPSHEH